MLPLIAAVLAGLVAIEHVGFMVLETFLWTTPKVRKIFGTTEADAETTKVLAKNQGVYNGVLGACILWALASGGMEARRLLLGFVVIVGLYGGATVKPRIALIQAGPAALGLALTFVS
jgi:putative membrane protein